MGACSSLQLPLSTIEAIVRAIDADDHRIALVLLEQVTENFRRYSKQDRLKIQQLNARVKPPDADAT